jgi:hypothetical protein
MSSSGFILIFQPGSGEIEKLVDELNQKLPDDVIAIPYHSLLNKNLLEFVQNIQDTYVKLALDKTTKFSELNDPTVGPNSGKYKRVVIVATNIAEASITINKLKYVIETGTQKTAIYDYTKRNTKLVTELISDSSRLQRRGRVGRVAPGDVYYLYDYGTTENIKTVCKICIQDISQELYRRLCANSMETMILNKNNDPNNPQIIINYEDIQLIYNKYFYNFEYYFNLDEYFDYFGNSSNYDYENYDNPSEIYETGYSIDNLNDYDGKFFIVHPEEIYIKRNLIGTITESKQKSNILNNNLLISEKLNVFWETLKNNNFLEYDDKNINKIETGIKFQRLQEIFEIEDPKIFRIFLYSFVFGVEEKVIRLLSLLENITSYTDSLLEGYYLNSKYIKPVDDILKIVGDCRGDLEGLSFLLEYYHKKLDSLNFDYDNDIELKKDTLRKHVNNLINANHDLEREQTYVQLKIEFDTINKFSGISDFQYNQFRLSGSIINTLNDIYNGRVRREIDNYCINKLRIKPIVMNNYMLKYSNIKNKLYLFKNKLFDPKEVKTHEYDLFNELIVYLKKDIIETDMNEYEKILSCFLLSDPYNLVNSLSGTNNYIFMYDPTLENIYKISTIGKFSKNLDSLANPVYLSRYVYYYKLDVDKESISIVNYLPLKLIKNLYKIFNPAIYGQKVRQLIREPINITKDDQIHSRTYKEKLNEFATDIYENYVDIFKSSKIKPNIEKSNIFNQKIKEIMK